MINLSNETDYKLIFKTKNLYNFFFLLTIVLFIGVFLKISILSLQEKNSPLDDLNNINSKIFSPTIYDTAGNRLAYSDYNFSIFKDKNLFVKIFSSSKIVSFILLIYCFGIYEFAICR